MYTVKLTLPVENWPYERQTPNSSGVWGDYKFYINQNIEKCDYWVVYGALNHSEKVYCPSSNTIFICGEPPSVKPYNINFLQQFATVVAVDTKIPHQNVLHTQMALPWHVGRNMLKDGNSTFSKDYDELSSMASVVKTKQISVITSNKIFTSGHRKRFDFVMFLKDYFGKDLDIFGKGVNDFEDKWDVISPYKYHITIENSSYPDYWTEKLTDAFLAYSIPIYYGCPNISDYFSTRSFKTIDINHKKQAVSIIENILASNIYEANLPDLIAARNLVLDKYNLFPAITGYIQASRKFLNPVASDVVIQPEEIFLPQQSYIGRTFKRVNNYLHKRMRRI